MFAISVYISQVLCASSFLEHLHIAFMYTCFQLRLCDRIIFELRIHFSLF